MLNSGSDVVSEKPFVKWVGGKTQLLPALASALPEFSNYHEPFVGGGALFFRLSKLGLLKDAYLYDSNEELLNLYEVVKNSPIELFNELQKDKYANEEDSFYRMRGSSPERPLERAARFVYLNRTAFNGLYRVNSQGKFNVPFGRYKKLSIPSKCLFMKDSAVLASATMVKGDFANVLDYAKAGDLVYFDPPYQPVSDTANFTSYTTNGFSEKDQVRLFKVFQKLDKLGCHVMLSNSGTELISSLYSDYYIEEVLANRAINCKADGRGKIKEFVVRNWKPAYKQKKMTEMLASTN
jgi:DNA adenine methylase